jgi:GNAT superfamily N-acetyltransferase
MKFSYVFTDEKNQSFIDLAKELWDEYYENVGDITDKYQELNNLEGEHFVILIFDENTENNKNKTPIACGSFSEFFNDTVEIKRVFVKNSYRNKGLATFIMEKLEKEAKKRNYTFAVLMTGVKNSSAQSLYKKLDYDLMKGIGIFKDDPDSFSFKKKL